MARLGSSHMTEIVSSKDDDNEGYDYMKMPLLDNHNEKATVESSTTTMRCVQGNEIVIEEPITDAEFEEMREQEEERVVSAINLAVKSAGNLTNLLPTGTFLFFQFLLPIVSNGGRCTNVNTTILNHVPHGTMNINAVFTLSLLLVCASSCFLLAFSDTVKLNDGKLYHGFATPGGLWLVNAGHNVQLSPASANYLRVHYRLRPIDFIHAFLSLSVFLASALFTPNVSDCLLKSISNTVIDDHDASSSNLTLVMSNSIPLVVGFIASFFCILFPTKRRGFDRPLLERLNEQKT